MNQRIVAIYNIKERYSELADILDVLLAAARK